MRIGISPCLLGREVRYDGGHRRDPFLVGTLGPHVEWVEVCPEVEAGLGTPREPIRLLRHCGEIRVVGVQGAADHTGAMRAFAGRKVRELAAAGLDGYVLKRGSPSCGMERVEVRGASGAAVRSGRGLFAAALMDRLPLLPVEEEGRLGDPALRDSFIERVFAHRRLRRLFAGRWTVGALARFHAANELVLLAHAPGACRRLGRLVNRAATLPRAELRARYEEGFMRVLSLPATRRGHARVLERLALRLRRAMDPPSRAELSGAIRGYGAGLVPLVVPLTLVAHHARRAGLADLAGQAYLSPDPCELLLRNHA